MNNTKWNDIFLAFHKNNCDSSSTIQVFYRTKALNGYISPWDNMWEHFGCEFEHYKDFEWLQIELTEENRDFVIDTLRKIHVPGEIQETIAIVYGYKQNCEYI